jgi:hypothetical protein
MIGAETVKVDTVAPHFAEGKCGRQYTGACRCQAALGELAHNKQSRSSRVIVVQIACERYHIWTVCETSIDLDTM